MTKPLLHVTSQLAPLHGRMRGRQLRRATHVQSADWVQVADIGRLDGRLHVLEIGRTKWFLFDSRDRRKQPVSRAETMKAAWSG